jgi:ribosomal protein L33
MSKRLTIDDLKSIAENRNHKVVCMDGYTDIKSKVWFFCNTCSEYFYTSVASYKNAKKTGCPHCRKITISKTQKGKDVSDETRKLLSLKAQGRKGSLKGKFGKNHPAYKGTPNRDFNNPSTDYYIWREAVKQRFNRTCVVTGKKSNLVTHHLDGWNAYPQRRYDITNGVLIHKEVHKLFHDLYGYGNNTEEQFNLFIKEQYDKAISIQATDASVEGSETTG